MAAEAESGGADTVQVAVRVRPMTRGEVEQRCVESLQAISETNLVVDGCGAPSSVGGSGASEARRAFQFDRVWGTEASQSEVFEGSVAPLVGRFLQGFNATVLAYGQTGSGKTHTMMGELVVAGEEARAEVSEEGVIPRVARRVFSEAEGRPAGSFRVRVSFLEVYREEVRDLLCGAGGNAGGNGGGNAGGGVMVREDPQGRVVVKGAVERPVGSAAELLQVMLEGARLRVVGGTQMNAQSSRSHAIFTLHLDQTREEAEEGGEEVEGGGVVQLTSKLHLVDLAGSERQRKTGASGARLQEAASINRGLLTLGSVIMALTAGPRGKRAAHVPYRDSKLTFLLKDSLGGNSATLMVACVSPADSNVDETVSTLLYATRARRIQNRVTRNEDSMATQIALLRRQVRQLQRALLLQGGTVSRDVLASLDDEAPSSSSSSSFSSSSSSSSSSALTDPALSSGSAALSEALQRLADAEATSAALRSRADALSAELARTGELAAHLESRLAKAEQRAEHWRAQAISGASRETEEVGDEKGGEGGDGDGGDDEGVFQGLDDDIEDALVLALRQRTRQAEMSAVEDALREKEALLDALAAAGTGMLDGPAAGATGLPSSSSVDLDTLTSEIRNLEAQHAETAEALTRLSQDCAAPTTHASSSSSSSTTSTSTPTSMTSTSSSGLEQKMADLEVKLREARQKLRDAQSMLAVRERAEARAATLAREISSLREERSRIARSMREGAKRFRQLQAQSDRELASARAADARTRAELDQVRLMATKREQALRIKTQELLTAQRRAREAEDRARSAAAANVRSLRGKAVSSRSLVPSSSSSSSSSSAASAAAAAAAAAAAEDGSVGVWEVEEGVPPVPRQLEDLLQWSEEGDGLARVLGEAVRGEVSARVTLQAATALKEDLERARADAVARSEQSARVGQADAAALALVDADRLSEEIAALGAYVADLRQLAQRGVRLSRRNQQSARWGAVMEKAPSEALVSVAQWLAQSLARTALALDSAQAAAQISRDTVLVERAKAEEALSHEKKARLLAEAQSARAARAAEEQLITVLGVRVTSLERESTEPSSEPSSSPSSSAEPSMPSLDEIHSALSSTSSASKAASLPSLRAQLAQLAALHADFSRETEARLAAEARAAELESRLRTQGAGGAAAGAAAGAGGPDSEGKKRRGGKTAAVAGPTVYIDEPFDPYGSDSSFTEDDSDDSDWEGERRKPTTTGRRTKKGSSTATGSNAATSATSNPATGTTTASQVGAAKAGSKREREAADEEDIDGQIAAVLDAVLADEEEDEEEEGVGGERRVQQRPAAQAPKPRVAKPPPAPAANAGRAGKGGGLQARSANTVDAEAAPKKRRVLGSGQRGSVGVGE